MGWGLHLLHDHTDASHYDRDQYQEEGDNTARLLV